MKINENEAILTPRVLLVPYCSHHVPTYHEWMQDEEIQKATASEPLSLAEEHAMQTSWRLDHDKLTFITCHAPTSTTEFLDRITPQVHDAPTSMIGDINLFIYEDEDADEHTDTTGQRAVVGEIEIMIADVPSRGQGLATEALRAFLWYISTYLDAILEEYRVGSDERSERYMKHLRVKIDQHNGRSVKLFEKIGFKKMEGGPNYFGEVEMRMNVVAEKGEGIRKVVFGI